MDLDEPLTSSKAETETLRDRLDDLEDKTALALAAAIVAVILVFLVMGERK
jgi:hypothetical protein